jgi:hypothetical protein
MGKICQVCNHKDCKDIERQLVSGRSKTLLSREYGVSTDSLNNHLNNHVTRQMATAMEMKKVENSVDLFQKAENLMMTLEGLLQKAKTKNQDQKLISVSRELRSIYELLAKFQFIASQQNEQKESEGTIFYHQTNDTVSENIALLDDIEKTTYFELLNKLMNGSDGRCTHIKYNCDLSVSNPEVNTIHYSDKKLSNNGSFKRTKGVSRPAPEQDAKDSYPTRVGPVESIEIPYDKTNRRRY